MKISLYFKFKIYGQIKYLLTFTILFHNDFCYEGQSIVGVTAYKKEMPTQCLILQKFLIGEIIDILYNYFCKEKYSDLVVLSGGFVWICPLSY